MIRYHTTLKLNYVRPHLKKVKHSCSIVVSYSFHRHSCLLDACTGDSGGPLMFFTESKQWELIGITSYGKGNSCATEYPGVYTRVTAFLSWIKDFVNNTSPQPLSGRCNGSNACACLGTNCIISTSTTNSLALNSSDPTTLHLPNRDRYVMRCSQISRDPTYE